MQQPNNSGRLYLVRHGETQWNRVGRMQGHLDSPLTLRGIDQARRLGALLARECNGRPLPTVTMSPLGRARQTAAIICEQLGLSYERAAADERLKEITWGDWDGMTRAEIIAETAELWRQREETHWDFVPPNGESYAGLAARIEGWYKSLEVPTDGLIVVCHGVVSRVLRGLALSLTNAEVLALDEPQEALFLFEGGRVLRVETAELGEALASDGAGPKA